MSWDTLGLQGYLRIAGLQSSGLTLAIFRATIFRAYLLQGLPSSGLPWLSSGLTLAIFRATIFRATIFRAYLGYLQGLPRGLPRGLPKGWGLPSITCIPEYIKYTPKHIKNNKNLHTSVDCAIIYTCVANTSNIYYTDIYTWITNNSNISYAATGHAIQLHTIY